MDDAQGFPADPMEQFEIVPLAALSLGGVDISFTNSSLFMAIVVFVAGGLLLMASRTQALRPGRLQAVGEILHGFVSRMLTDNAGPEARKYFPFIFTLFMFVATANLVGMVPYSFTVTSHLAVTLTLALVIFVGATIIGFARNGFGYLRLFAPAGVPWWLMPLLVTIELISYFIRPISLSVRLFANMMAGHTMLKVFAGFVVLLGFAGVAPLLVMSALTGLEIVIALLQAFIFSILACIYLNDALHPHH